MIKLLSNWYYRVKTFQVLKMKQKLFDFLAVVLKGQESQCFPNFKEIKSHFPH